MARLGRAFPNNRLLWHAPISPSSVSLADIFALADSISFGSHIDVLDLTTLADILSLKTGITINDTLSLTEAISTLIYKSVSVDDAMTLAEALAFAFGKPLTDNATLIDQIETLTFRAIDDSALLTDALTVLLNVEQAETLSLLDTLTLRIQTAWAETSQLQDTVGYQITLTPQYAPTHARYGPRPLITLTIGVLTKRYSTEDLLTLELPVTLGLMMHLQAQRILGLVNGSPVSTWLDQSGNNFHATQATASFQPIFTTNALNGLAVVSFDGVNDYLVSSLARTQPYSVFIVGKTAPGGVNQYYLDGANGNEGVVSNVSVANRVGMYAGVVLDRPSIDGDYQIIYASFNGASSTIVRNSVATTGNAGTQNTSGTTIGRYAGGGYSLHGDIAEMCIYNRVLTSAEQLAVEEYLSMLYGIVLG